MSMPGFNAEASLYRTSDMYRVAGTSDPMAGAISPSWGIDCYPMCMIFARARCRKMCPPHSIDCIPMCLLRAERRCRSQCQGSFGGLP